MVHSVYPSYTVDNITDRFGTDLIHLESQSDFGLEKRNTGSTNTRSTPARRVINCVCLFHVSK